MGLVAPRHVGSSQARAQTRVSCIGRRILNHCATREAQDLCKFYTQILKIVGTVPCKINYFLIILLLILLMIANCWEEYFSVGVLRFF